MADIIRPVYNEIWASSGEFFSPGSAKISSGWVQELMPYQYENFLQNRNDTSIAYLLQKGVPEWDSAQEYIANKSIVSYSSNLYISLVNNTGVSPTDTVTWRKLTVTVAPNGTIPISSGGTGATTPTDARTNLGLGTAATISADSIVLKSITGNAPAADKWTNSITLTLSGGAAGSTSFDGSGNATLNITGLNASSISSGTVPVSALNNAVLKTSATGSLILPSGTTGQRDVSPQEGYTRWNSTTKQKETFNGAAWTLDTSQSEAYLLNRANHTGVQPISSVSDLSSSLDLKVPQTSPSGAAVLPSGTTIQRPDPSLTSGLLVRGNTDTGKPEWYNRPLLAWKNLVDEDQLGVVDAQVQTLDANIGFTIIYPNGGSEASPASVSLTSIYVENNPFPGHHVICECQLYAESKWITAPYQPYGSTGSVGASAAHDSNLDKIRVSTGSQFLVVGTNTQMFASPRPTNNYTGPLPCRVLVWKLKGAI